MRRFTRLTNAFSKKVENHAAAVALYAMHYNFCRVHQTLRVTPAMEAGLTDRVWSLPELVGLLDCEQALSTVENRKARACLETPRWLRSPLWTAGSARGPMPV